MLLGNNSPHINFVTERMNDTMNKYIDKFQRATQTYLKEIKYTGLSETTAHNYKRRLKYFEDFWAQGNPQSDPTRDDIRSWRDAALEQGASPATVKQYLIELGAFFNFCVDEETYAENPVSKRMFPKLAHGEAKPYDKLLDSESIAKLWENKQSGENWARNYAIITLLLDGKIRNAELLDMKLSDIDFEYGEAIIRRGKGNKYRIVSLNDISLSAIQLYLRSGARPNDLTDDDYLFGTCAEHKMRGRRNKTEWHKGSSQWLSSLVERHVKSVTGKSGFRTHSLRHNGAMLELNNGVSMERLQSELGHSSVTTTEIYAGKLGSKRHQRGFRTAIEARDYWAEQNKALLEKKGA